jgi:hypothetical protein
MAAPDGKLTKASSPGERRVEGRVWTPTLGFGNPPAAPATPAAPRRSLPLRLSLKSLPSIISPKRLGWRGLLALSLSAVIVGVSAYALVYRGGGDVRIKETRRAAPAAAAAPAASAANPSDFSVSIPLPSRRPSTFRTPSRDPVRRAAPESEKEASGLDRLRSLFDL